LSEKSLLAIDTQIWIYYYDPNTPEYDAIHKWLEPVLHTEDILLSAIIPVEIAHNLFTLRNSGINLDADRIEELLIELLSMEKCHFIDIDQDIVAYSIFLLKKLRNTGVGGRDAIIVASMERFGVNTIVTHDKNILALESYHRIDPVFDPPLELHVNDVFDSEDFKSKMNDLINHGE